MRRWQIAKFAGCSIFDPILDEIESDQTLYHFFIYMYYYHFQDEGNIDQMYSSDLLWWMIQGMDAVKTGEHNHAVNPKKKQTKIKPFNTRRGETFFRQDGIIPIRWAKAFGREIKLADEVKKEPKPEMTPIEKMLLDIRKANEKRKMINP